MHLVTTIEVIHKGTILSVDVSTISAGEGFSIRAETCLFWKDQYASRDKGSQVVRMYSEHTTTELEYAHKNVVQEVRNGTIRPWEKREED